MGTSGKSFWNASIPLMGLLALASPAHGQTVATADAVGPQPQDIIVTATRREEVLSKVPISVSVFSQARADQLGIKTFEDVVKFTPGVSMQRDNSNNIVIRGISSDAGSRTTGIYIDDTPIQTRQIGYNANNTLPIIFDLERIEILRGPQGTLFGSGSEGGTVRFITHAPDMSQPSAYARSEVSATRHGAPSYEFGVAYGAPIVTDTLGYRLSAFFRRDGGYIDRVDPYTGSRTANADSINSIALRGALAWAPTPEWTITPSMQYQRRQNNGTDVGGYFLGLGNPSAGNFVVGTPDRVAEKDIFHLGALKVERNGENVNFISNTSYFSRKDISNEYDGTMYNLSYFQHSLDLNNASYGGYDPIGNPCAACRYDLYPLLTSSGINPQFIQEFGAYHALNLVTNRQKNFTQEFRVQSAMGSNPLKWTVGTFYSNIRQKSVERIYDHSLEAVSQYLFGEDLETAWGVPLLPGDVSYENNIRATESQIALFADIIYTISEKINLNIGMRWARTHFAFSDVAQGPQAFVNGPPPVGGAQNESVFTPKFNLMYQITPNKMVYATAAKGSRIGGANAPLPAQCDAPQSSSKYGSDSLWSYELGTKLNLLGNKMQISASSYIIKWSNIQQNVYINSCGLQFIANLGALTSKGMDLEAEAHLTDTLKLNMAVGYTHAGYSQDSIIPGNPPIVTGFKGDKVAGAPWTLAAGLQQDFTISGRKAFLRVDDAFASHNRGHLVTTDPRQVNGENAIGYDPNLVTDPAINMVSIRAEINIGPMEMSVFVNNLFDSHPQIDLYHMDQDSALYSATTIRPRTFGLFVSSHI